MSQYYKDAGVDIEAGYQAVERMQKHVRQTFNKGVMSGLGSFGAPFDLQAYGFHDPILVSGTDGVGTKIKIAQTYHRHETIGIDCVAMCVNDILAQGARPLFFLDYLAVHATDPLQVETIVASVAQGCIQAGCALIGGETAEMSDLYAPGDYDLAGFSVGCANREDLMNVKNTHPGQKVIGLASNGLHANGFTLVRKVLFKDHDTDVHDELEGKPLLDHLLAPTRIYVKPVLKLMETGKIKGIAHITGGGFMENIPRCLDQGLGVTIHKHSWEVPAIFKIIKQKGAIPCAEMHRVFNMGIGMVLIVEAEDEAAILQQCHDLQEKAWSIGEVTAEAGVQLL